MHEQPPPGDAGSHAAVSAAMLVARGNAQVRQRRIPDALESYRSALVIQPQLFEAQANLGSALLALGRFADAEPPLSQALSQRPDQAPLHRALGIACGEQGKLVQAETCFRHALTIASEDVETHWRLANVLCGQDRKSEAEQSYLKALSIAPDNVEVLVDLGGLLRRQARFAEAETCYRRALATQPEDARSHYGLGHCHVAQGRVADAIGCFERAIAAKPDYVDAHYRLSVLRRAASSDAWLARVESLQPTLTAMALPQQVRYWFVLGKMREDAGQYGAAFSAYTEGNRLQRQWLGLDKGYRAHEAFDTRFVERIRTVFTDGLMATHQCVDCDESRVPIFIVGMPRSGTTLIEQILAAHPEVHGGGELRDFPGVLETFGFAESPAGDAYPEVVTSLSAQALRRVGEDYLERVWKQAPASGYITDKLTGNFLHVGMIHLALPQAKIIHAVRDPMDSCFSCFANVFESGSMPHTYELGTLGRDCERYLRLMRHWGTVLPEGAVLDMRYEDLVSDTEHQIRRLLDFIGLPWDDRCLAFHQQQRVVHTVSVGQVSNPIYHSSVARWKHFRKHLGPLLEIVGGYR